MQEQTKKKIDLVIADNIRGIKSPTPKHALAHDPELQNNMLKSDAALILERLEILRGQYTELLPFVKHLHTLVKDITEQTHVCATYLVLCYTFDNWESLFFLADKYKAPGIGNMLRMVKEGDSLIHAFAIEGRQGGRKLLDKWLSGAIVGPEAGRNALGDFFKAQFDEPQLDTKKLDAHIYQMESQTPHCAYGPILNMVSPFTEDYDFDKYTAAHRTLGWLSYASGSMTGTNLALKEVYKTLLIDEPIVVKLDEIMLRYDDEVAGPVDFDALKDFLQ